MNIRLQKAIAASGIASRRKAEEMIVNGRITVNGKVVTQLGTKVNPEKDRIEVDGQPIQFEQHHYYLFYKPMNVITSVSDPQGRRVVTDYFKHIPVRLFPVGRLDYETEGLLIMTNDGEFAYRMTHPKFEIEKSYLALVEGQPSHHAIKQLRQGVKLDDGVTAPANVKRIRTDYRGTWIRLTIHEGRYRQVRRMFASVGHPVIKLIRDRIGNLHIGQLRAGQYRSLTSDEVTKLKKLYK